MTEQSPTLSWIAQLLTSKSEPRYLLYLLILLALLISPLFLLSTTSLLGVQAVESRMIIIDHQPKVEDRYIILNIRISILTRVNTRIGFPLNTSLINIIPNFGMSERIVSYSTSVTKLYNLDQWHISNGDLFSFSEQPFRYRLFKASGQLQEIRAMNLKLVIEIDDFSKMISTDTFQYHVDNLISLPMLGTAKISTTGIIHFARVYSDGPNDSNPSKPLIRTQIPYHNGNVYIAVLVILLSLYLFITLNRIKKILRHSVHNSDRVLYPKLIKL